MKSRAGFPLARCMTLWITDCASPRSRILLGSHCGAHGTGSPCAGASFFGPRTARPSPNGAETDALVCLMQRGQPGRTADPLAIDVPRWHLQALDPFLAGQFGRIGLGPGWPMDVWVDKATGNQHDSFTMLTLRATSIPSWPHAQAGGRPEDEAGVAARSPGQAIGDPDRGGGLRTVVERTVEQAQ